MAEKEVTHIWGETEEGYQSRVKAHKEAVKPQLQSVLVTLDDGRMLVFSGKAYPDIQGRRVRQVQFTAPRDLPEGCYMDTIEHLGAPTPK